MAVQTFKSNNSEQMIKDGRRYEARNALIDLLTKDKRNPQLLWMLVQVTDNSDELYRILRTLVALPNNPYTSLARARLNRLVEKNQHQPRPHSSYSSRSTSSMRMIVVAICVVILTSTAIIVASQVFKPAAPPPAPAAAVVVWTRVAPPTLPPLPTATPISEQSLVSEPTVALATTTPVPEATSVPLAVILPENYDKFAKNVVKFDENYDLAVAIIESGKPLTFTMLDKISKYQAKMREARTGVILISPINLPEDVRRDIMLPAQNAFIASANARLSLIDANLELHAMQETLAKDVSSGASTAQQTVNAKTKDIQQRQEGLVMLRQTEQTLAAKYGAFVAYIELQQSRDQTNAKFYYGVGTDPNTKISLGAGTYRITTKGQNTNIALRSLGDAKTQPLEMVKIVTLSEGVYTVDTSGWWALAIENNATTPSK